MADSEPKMLLKHIGLKPGQYSPLSKLKLACIGTAMFRRNAAALVSMSKKLKQH